MLNSLLPVLYLLLGLGICFISGEKYMDSFFIWIGGFLLFIYSLGLIFGFDN